jgi:hypothetical protein
MTTCPPGGARVHEKGSNGQISMAKYRQSCRVSCVSLRCEGVCGGGRGMEHCTQSNVGHALPASQPACQPASPSNHNIAVLCGTVTSLPATTQSHNRHLQAPPTHPPRHRPPHKCKSARVDVVHQRRATRSSAAACARGRLPPAGASRRPAPRGPPPTLGLVRVPCSTRSATTRAGDL